MVKASERLGNYEVASTPDGKAVELGKGAGGITYRGRHVHLGTEVAIKVLLHRKNVLQKDRDAFLAEARAAASLAHSQIARILDFGESAQQHPYYVMELCEGGSLEDFGRRSSQPDAYSAVQWLFESASALAYAHQKNILHRDIKPSNLLIARHDQAASLKLIDFGLADLADKGESDDKVIGTPHFAAPEQLLGKAQPASDVFSLGATFLWLLTGKHLFEGDVRGVISERLESTGYSRHLAPLPPAWQGLLGKMLEIDPSLRPQDGSELFATLQMYFPHHAGHPVPWGPHTASPDEIGGAQEMDFWQHAAGTAWTDLWVAQTPFSQAEHGVTFTALRQSGQVPYDVSLFTALEPELTDHLIRQGNLLVRHGVGLGLGDILLESGDGWWTIAWPSLPATDALSWVRQGNNASVAEILAALDPIASALDAMSANGLGNPELHPSMLSVTLGPPLQFSLAVSLPVVENSGQQGNSSSTLRGASGAGLPALFASTVYQILSGRTPPPAAFANARAYQAIPRLAESSNRFLATSIAGSLPGGNCSDVIRGLVHEERIPGASFSGSIASRSAAGLRSNPGISLPSRSSGASLGPFPSISPPPLQSAAASSSSIPVVAVPAPAMPPSPPQATPPAIPAIVSSPPPAPDATPASPGPAAAPRKRSAAPVLIVLSVLLIGFLGIGAGGWYLLKKSGILSTAAEVVAHTPPPGPVNQTDPTITTPEPVAPPADPTPPAADPAPALKADASMALVKVPEDAATFADALRLCQTDGVIEVSSGVHQEAFVITRSVSIMAKSAAVIEIVKEGSSIVTVKGPVKAIFKNIQFRDSRKEATGGAEASPPLLLVSDGAFADFQGCTIEGSMGNGVSLTGKASGNFGSCRIRKNRGNGINASGGSKVSVSLSEIRENGFAGLSALNPETTVNLENGTYISENHRNGIEIGSGANLEGTGVAIQENKPLGVLVEGSGSVVTLNSGTVISKNGKYGILCRNEGKVRLQEVSVEQQTETGITIINGGTAEIVSGEIRSNGKMGINADSTPGEGPASPRKVSLKISGTTVTGHLQAEIYVFAGKGGIEGCNVSTAGSYGIAFGEGSEGKIKGNTISGSSHENAVFVENSTVDVSDNKIAP